MKQILILFFLLFQFYLVAAQDCIGGRWKVKTLTDADTVNIDFDTVLTTTVHEQVNLQAPIANLHERIKSERKVFSMECILIGFRLEHDHDIHIIVRDIHTEETMVVEIIDPECEGIKNTSRYEQFKNLRAWFFENIGNPRTSFTYPSAHPRLQLTGVGFWDSFHGQKGMSSNGREIHPVLTMQLKPHHTKTN